MAEWIVVCDECEDVKSWRWLCLFCAEECQVAHRRESGHMTHVTVTVDDEDALAEARRRR